MTNDYFGEDTITLIKQIVELIGNVEELKKAGSACAALSAVGCLIYDSYGANPGEFGPSVMNLMPTAKEAVAELKANGVSL